MERSLTLLWSLFFSSCLLWTLGMSMPQNAQENLCIPSNEKPKDGNTNEQKSSLLSKIETNLEPEKLNNKSMEDTSSEDQTPYQGGPLFLDSFLHHLQERKSENQTIPEQSNFLEITIQDGSSSKVKIDLSPGIITAQTKGWGDLVNLLANTLASVVQEAERLGLHPTFQYSISLEEQGSVFYISSTALKSAVG